MHKGQGTRVEMTVITCAYETRVELGIGRIFLDNLQSIIITTNLTDPDSTNMGFVWYENMCVPLVSEQRRAQMKLRGTLRGFSIMTCHFLCLFSYSLQTILLLS